MSDNLAPSNPITLRSGPEHLAEDRQLLEAGILDPVGFESGYEPQLDPVELRVTRLIDDDERLEPFRICRRPEDFTRPVLAGGELRDAAFGMRLRKYVAVRRSHNTRVTMGRDQIQRVQMFGDVGSGSLNGLTGNATSTTATSLTNTGAAFPTATSSAGNAGLQGKVVVAGTVLGVIVSNTATVLTVDQWYAIPVTGAAGATPAGTVAYVVLPGAAWTAWIGLSTNSAAVSVGDVLRTADGLFGDGTTGGAATEQTASGLARAYVACTYGAGTAVFSNTWTYTGSTAVTIAKGVLCNSKAAAGSLMLLETLLSATATVSANGDNIPLTWTVTL